MHQCEMGPRALRRLVEGRDDSSDVSAALSFEGCVEHAALAQSHNIGNDRIEFLKRVTRKSKIMDSLYESLDCFPR